MAMIKIGCRLQVAGCRKCLKPRGFALLISIIFMSVMLSMGLVLGSLAYKQSSLASAAIESQDAFYAADAALECALYVDQKQNAFVFNPDINAPVPTFSCSGAAPYLSPVRTYAGIGSTAKQILTYRFLLDGVNCADVTIYKPYDTTAKTYLFAQGYSVSCATVANANGARFSSRGVEAHY